MRPFALLPAFALSLVLLCGLSAPLQAKDLWSSNFSRAKEEAKLKRRPILLLVTGSDWCPACMWMEKNVFASPSFKAWAPKSIVPVIADFPRKSKLPPRVAAQNQRLQKAYGATRYPTMLLLDWRGKVCAKIPYTSKIKSAQAWVQRTQATIEASFDSTTGLARVRPRTPAKQDSGSGDAPAPKKPPTQHKDSGAASGPGWEVEFAEAEETSRKTKRPLLVLFTCSDGNAGRKLHEQVFATQAFQDWAGEAVVRVEVDFPTRKRQSPRLKLANVRLKSRFGVRSLPSVLLVSPQGDVIASLDRAPRDPARWIEQAQAALNKGR